MSALAFQQAPGCICGKHMIERVNEGTCLWCGHGRARMVLEQAYRLNMESNTVSAVFTTPNPDSRVVPLRRAPSHSFDEDACVAAYRAWERDHGHPPTSTDWQAGREKGEHRPTYAHVLKLFGGWPAFKRYIAQVPKDQVAVA